MNASERYLWGGGVAAVIVIGLIIGAVRPNKHAQAAPASVPDVQVVNAQRDGQLLTKCFVIGAEQEKRNIG